MSVPELKAVGGDAKAYVCKTSCDRWRWTS